MIIKRDRYLDLLKRKMWNGSIKIVTGVRRCGKSVLLNTLFKDYLKEAGVDDDHIIMISLEKLSNRKYRDPEALNDKIRSQITDDGKYYIIIDEIQFVDDFVDLLNEYVGDPRIDVYVSGSTSHLLSKDIITEFRGRGDVVRVHPLSFSEYVSAYGGDERKLFKDYMIFGGMPGMLSMDNDSEKMAYLINLFEEVYLKDIVERNNLKNYSELGYIVDILSSSIGSMINPKKISDTINTVESAYISKNTVVDYIDCLIDSFLFEEVRRYDIMGRKHIGALYKYYSEDIGLRNARLEFRQQDYTNIMENLVYNELRIRGFVVNVGVINAYNSKSIEHTIDFIATMGDRKYYIQSAFSIPDEKKREQETSSLRKVNDSFKKIIVTNDDVRTNVDEYGIITMNIIDFLLDDRILETY